MARHRRMGVTRTKVGITHADTNLLNQGSGSAPASFNVLETDAGARTLTGATQVIQDNADTGEVCRVGDIVKYVNLFLEIGPRNEIGTDQDRTGWLEWAFCCVKESETAVPITNVGTQTLATICKNMFRGECIFTGAVPVGTQQPNTMSIQIKIPKGKSSIHIGDEWRFITWFRSVSSTAAGTGNVRVIKSFMYKAYS